VFDDPVAAQAQWQLSIDVLAQPFLQALQQPDRALQLMLLGRAYLAQNDLGQDYLVLAQRAFDEAAAINPGYAEAQPSRALCAINAGPTGARGSIGRWSLIPIYRWRAIFARGIAGKRADLGGRSTISTYAIERDPTNALIAAEIGRVYTQRSDFANAEQWLTKARDLKPQRRGDLEIAGRVVRGPIVRHDRSGVATARQIVALAPADAEARMVGRAYLRSGDRGGASVN